MSSILDNINDQIEHIDNQWVTKEKYDQLETKYLHFKGYYDIAIKFNNELMDHFLGENRELLNKYTNKIQILDGDEYNRELLNIIKSNYRGYKKPFKERLKHTFRFYWDQFHTNFHIGDWYTGFSYKAFDLTYRECGYEDGYARLVISMFGWHSVFILPWKSKRFPHGDCDEPIWGIQVHDNTIWIRFGGDGNGNNTIKRTCLTWDIPFFTKKCVRHEVECKDVCKASGFVLQTHFESYNELTKQNKGEEHIPLEDNPKVNVHIGIFVDRYDGSKILCKYWLEEREWRPKWLTWTGLFKDVHKQLEISFSKEVGSRKGSWKGGVMGTSINLLKGETLEQGLHRLEVTQNW